MQGALNIIAAMVLATGIALAGFFVHDGIAHIGSGNRTVQVKGLAEQSVIADVGVWSIQYSSSNANLDKASSDLKSSELKIREFLSKFDIKDDAVKSTNVSADQDGQSSAREGYNSKYEKIYMLNQTLTVKTNDVNALEKASQGITTLLEDGVLIQSSQSPRYIFTKLNDIKPQMIGDATHAARKAADKFAQDSGANVGEIIKARQGVFSIQSVYGNNSIEQKVRVVNTIDFELID